MNVLEDFWYGNLDPTECDANSSNCSVGNIGKNIAAGCMLRLCRLPGCPAGSKVSFKVILIRSLVQRKGAPMCRYYISNAIVKWFESVA